MVSFKVAAVLVIASICLIEAKETLVEKLKRLLEEEIEVETKKASYPRYRADSITFSFLSTSSSERHSGGSYWSINVMVETSAGNFQSISDYPKNKVDWTDSRKVDGLTTGETYKLEVCRVDSDGNVMYNLGGDRQRCSTHTCGPLADPASGSVNFCSGYKK